MRPPKRLNNRQHKLARKSTISASQTIRRLANRYPNVSDEIQSHAFLLLILTASQWNRQGEFLGYYRSILRLRTPSILQEAFSRGFTNPPKKSPNLEDIHYLVQIEDHRAKYNTVNPIRILEEQEFVDRAIQSLPKSHQEPFRLLLDRSQKEVSQILQMSPSRISKIFRESQTFLREFLENHHGTPTFQYQNTPQS